MATRRGIYPENSRLTRALRFLSRHLHRTQVRGFAPQAELYFFPPKSEETLPFENVARHWRGWPKLDERNPIARIRNRVRITRVANLLGGEGSVALATCVHIDDGSSDGFPGRTPSSCNDVIARTSRGGLRALDVTVMITAGGTIIGCAAEGCGGNDSPDLAGTPGALVPFFPFFLLLPRLFVPRAERRTIVFRIRCEIRYDLHLVFRAPSARPDRSVAILAAWIIYSARSTC